MINYKVNDIITPAELSGIHVGGNCGKMIDLFFETRVLSDFGKNEVFEETITAMREQKDDDTLVGFWRGEFWGKLAISASRVYLYTKDESLKEFLIDSTHRLLTLQREDGYLGSYKDADNIFPADGEKTREIIGWPCVWNWNVWCRKYTLWGLIEVYQITGDKEILCGAVKLADHLISQLERLGTKLHNVGTFYGLPAGSILKPMLMLYRITEDKKYLDFCLDNVKDWEREDGEMPNLITNALEYKKVHEWYPDPNSWAKAYEMMSCLDGLVELYRITGDKKYFKTVENMYKLLRKYEYNVLFSVGHNDQFADGANCENSLTEPCDVIHWMRVCSELYKLTGKSCYMDDIERAFYNPLLAGTLSDGTYSARVVRTQGMHGYEKQMDLKYSHCCTNNMPRGYLNFAESFCMFDKDTLYVNFYTEYTGILNTPMGKVDVEIYGTYLVDGKVHINIKTEKPMAVKFRIPAYSESTSIYIGDKLITPVSGDYCETTLKAGENTVHLDFTWKAEVRDYTGDISILPENHYKVRRFVEGTYRVETDHMVWNRRSTLVYGPLLLARSKKNGNTSFEMFGSDRTVCGRKYTCTLTPVQPKGTHLRFEAHFQNADDSFNVSVCDFATGTNERIKGEQEYFSVWF